MKLFLVQMKLIMAKQEYQLVVALLFLFVLVNYGINLCTWYGHDVTELYHPMGMMLLANNNAAGHCFFTIYPFLAVIPAGFSIWEDTKTRTLVYHQSRIGAGRYYISRFFAIFWASFLAFTLPFMAEALIEMAAFPCSANGNIETASVYSEYFFNCVSRYLLSELYKSSIYLYLFGHIFIMGVTSGVLAVFTAAISTLGIRYKVFLLLPAYLVLYLLNYLPQLIPSIGFTTIYQFYLSAFLPYSFSGLAAIGFLLFLLVVSLIFIVRKEKSDCLL